MARRSGATFGRRPIAILPCMFARLVRQSSVYALAGIVGKLSGVVLTAFYIDTAYLPVEAYGYFGVLRAAMMTALLVAGAGLPLGIIRFATSSELSAPDRASVPSTALGLATLSGLLSAGLIWIAAPALASLLGGGGLADASGAAPIRWMALFVLFKTVADVSYTELRHREQVGGYVAVSAAESALLLGAVLWFLVVQREGLEGVIKGYAVSSGVVACVATVALLREVSWRPQRALVAPMLRFGIPLILSGLAIRFLYFGDRFVIARMVGLDANATYELASQFGTLVYTFLVQGVQLAFTVTGMKVFGDAAAAALYRRSFRHFAAIAGAAVLGIGLFASSVVRLFATESAYLDIDAPAVLVAGGFAFNGLYNITVSALYAAGMTRTVAFGVTAAAGLNLALNLALIPVMGVNGAAVATLVAYAALAVFTGRRTEPLVGTGLPWGRVLAISIATTALWWLGQSIGPTGVSGLALRVGLLALYPVSLALLGVYRREDLAAARAALRARRGSHDARR